MVVLKTFDVRRQCMMDEFLARVDVSGQFPELLPARSFSAINANLRRTVLDRVEIDCTLPLKPFGKRVDSEMFDECEVTLRTADLLAVSCRVGWNGLGPGMGVHPDGQVEDAIYRIQSGDTIEAAGVLRQDRLDDLRRLLEARFREDNPQEFADADPEWVTEVLAATIESPLLTRHGLLLRYAGHHYDFELTLPYSDAAQFLQPSILAALKTRTPPN